MNNNPQEQFPSKCWDCEFARRTWSEELEDQGFTGCSYILNSYFHKNGEKSVSDLFDHTDVDSIREGWITQRRPLDRSENGGGSTFNLQPIMHSVKNCKLYEKRGIYKV